MIASLPNFIKRPPSVKRSKILSGLVLAVLLLVPVLSLFSKPEIAYAAPSSNLNFQARLLTSSGNVVPDGYYNIEFKLYDVDSGGSALWTETYYDSNGPTAGNDNRLRVYNGYLTVNLGSLNSFPGTINWNEEHWLTMNVGGSTHTATPTYDGEMNPRLKLTAVAYSFRAGQLAKTDSGNTGVLQFGSLTANRLITLPDEDGTVCLQNSANCGFALSSGSGNYIQNGTSPQTADFNITGAGTVGGLFTGSAGATISGAAINLNASSNFATNINTGTSTGAVSIGNSAAGAIAVQSGTSITLTGVTNINTTGTANTAIGNATGTFALTSSGLNVTTAGAISGVTSLTASGTITGNLFSGSGASLTNLNASNLSSGTVPSARVSGSYTSITGVGALTAGSIGSGFGNINIGSNTFTGNGSGLTALNASNISSGTLGVANGGTGANTLTAGGILFGNGTGAVTASAVLTNGQLLIGDGSGAPTAATLTAGSGVSITNGAGSITIAADTATLAGDFVQLQSTTPGTAQTGNLNISGTAIAGTFSGSGSGLTSLNASNISSGTLNDARLSSNVTVQGNTFNGASQLVQLNGSTQLPAVSGVNLTNLNASNLASGTVNDARLSANVALKNINNSFSTSQSITNAGGKTTLALTSTGTDTGITLGGDTNLYRSAANTLMTDDALTVAGLLTGQAGATIAGGAISLNTTGTANTAIGNATGTFALTSSGLNVSTAGALSGVTSLGASGTITANLFSGSGASLTSLDAGNISSGTLAVARGGTGANTLTAGGILFGNGTSAITASSVLTNGQLLIGDGSGAPTIATLTAGTGVSITNGAGSITIAADTSALAGSFIQLQNTTPGTAQTGHLNITGTAIAGTFSGSGASLTSLNASNVSSGTLNDARLSSNVTVQGNTFNGASQLVQMNASTQLPAVSGVNLTNLNATNLASGTVANARLSGSYTSVTGVGALTTGSIGSGFGNINIGSNTFTGNGSGLTALNGSNISTGTVADARLSSNVALQNAANNFTAAQTISNNGGKTTLAITSTGTDTGITIGGDTNLYRSSANNLRTDDTFEAIAYRANGSAGSSVTCAGGQFLQNQVVVGGIVTGGTCASAGGGSISLQAAYDGGSTIVANGSDIVFDLATNPGRYFEIIAPDGTNGFYNPFRVYSQAISDYALAVSTDGELYSGGSLYVSGWVGAYGGASLSGGAVNINASSNNTTNINTGSSTGAINIGNSSAGAISMSSANHSSFTARSLSLVNTDSGFGIGLTAAGGISMSSATGTTINTSVTSNTSIGNATGTLTLTGNNSSTIVLNGVTISATELNRLDGKDAALIDTNDAVNTAITGTGALTAGSIGSGFGNINIGSNTFTGNGSGLTALNAGNISTGTLADARLSSNVALLNAANNFTAAQTISNNGGKTTLALTSTGTNTGITLGGDTNLFRSSANNLATDDAFTIAGLLTGNAGATINGAAINLNVSSNFATNINTGSSTGAVSIGNSANGGAVNLQSSSYIQLLSYGGIYLNDSGGSGIFLDSTYNIDVTAQGILNLTGVNGVSLNPTGSGNVNIGNYSDTSQVLIDAWNSISMNTHGDYYGGISLNAYGSSHNVYISSQYNSITMDAYSSTIGLNAANIQLSGPTDIYGRTSIGTYGGSTQKDSLSISGGGGDTPGITLQSDTNIYRSAANTLKTDGNLIIGNSDTTGHLLVLDTKTNAGDPTGTNGAMYYSTNTNSFRCYENSTWKNCISPGNASTADQAIGASTTAYLAGSAIPLNGLRAGSTITWRLLITKTAASTATNSFHVRFGTNGTTSDTARCTFTTSAQTIHADAAEIILTATVRSVGASGTMYCSYRMVHSGAAVNQGFDNARETRIGDDTTGTFATNTANSIMGISMSTGASHSITVRNVITSTVNF